jgi:hypothetical protein
MMEATRTSVTSVDNYFTRQYIPEDKSELHTRRRENLKSHILLKFNIQQDCEQLLAPRKCPQRKLFLNVPVTTHVISSKTHLAEELCFDALLTLKVGNSLIYLASTRVPKRERQFILPLKTFTENKEKRCRSLE